MSGEDRTRRLFGDHQVSTRLPVELRHIAALTLGLVFALYLRYLFRAFESADFRFFTSVWYSTVQERGSAALAGDISNYNPPYIYLLYLTSIVVPDMKAVYAIKLPSVAFDVVCAWFTSRITALKYRNGPAPWFAFLAVLLAPTVVTNGAVWGQADSIYTSMLVACVYLLMTGRSSSAMIAFGLALSFKLQAIFLAPALGALWLRRTVSFRDLLLVPIVCLVMLIPAWLAGRPFSELATIYVAHGVTYQELTQNAPTLYAWLPQRFYGILVVAGLLLMTGIGVAFVWTVVRSSTQITAGVILKLSLLSLLITPFFLPKMHDRFFYPADVLSIAYGFFFPRHYYVPVAVSFASFFAYQPFLFGREPLPLQVLSLVMLAALLVVARDAYGDLAGRRAVPMTPAA